MSEYIETRPEVIAAIHKSITEKWNPICMGCGGDKPYNIECSLCDSFNSECGRCPLSKISDSGSCTDSNTEYSKWYHASSVFDCENCCAEKYCKSGSTCDKLLPSINAPAEAEAMLEALVMLLPESERKIYGG